jgi:ABC-2 type transport system permease protein
VGSFHDPASASLDGSGDALAGDLAVKAQLAGQLAGDGAVVADVQVAGAADGQDLVQLPADGGQAGPAAASRAGSRGTGDAQRDAVALGGQRAFQPAFAPVHRRRPGTLTPTWRLGQAPIHHHITQLQADHLVIGAQRSRRQQARQPPGSTLTLFAEYIPVLICLSLCLIALVSLPIPLVNNRQMGVLRRSSTTAAPQSWLLAAQVVINLVLAVLAIVILVAGGALLFGVHPAAQLAGFVVSVVLATAAMFAIGLLIAAIAPSTPVAGAAGTVLLYPMLFFAGLWAPQQNLSPLLQHIGNYTPLGAAVQAMEAAMQGNLPSARPLLVMAAYAIVFGIAAVKLFRWE